MTASLHAMFTEDGIRLLSRIDAATTFLGRLKGLLGRDSLADDEGLLLSPGGSVHTFGMRFSIDVLFLDEHMRIVKLALQIKPWRVVLAPLRTRSVVELASGRANALGLRVGMRLTAKHTTAVGSRCYGLP